MILVILLTIAPLISKILFNIPCYRSNKRYSIVSVNWTIFSPEKRQDIAAKTSTEDEIESFKKEMYEKLDKAIEILLTKGTNYKQNKNIIVRISDDSYAKKTIKQREFKTI